MEALAERTEKEYQVSQEEKVAELRRLVKRFSERAERISASFSIIVYGSTSYGYNEECHGKFDDIDMILTVPRGLSSERFIAQARYVFQSDFSLDHDHFDGIADGRWDMCRMYGVADGVRLGFRIMNADAFGALASEEGSQRDVRNVATPGSSRIIRDAEWSFEDWGYKEGELQNEEVTDANGGTLVLVKHHVFGEDGATLGAFGRKLLISQIAYAPGSETDTVLKAVWKRFVSACLQAHPDLSNDQIIDAIFRSERFPREFRDRLSTIIDLIRAELAATR